MDIWYARLSEHDLLSAVSTAARALKRTDKEAAKGAQKRAEKVAEKARARDSLQALSKLAERVDGRYQIVSQPPVVVPLREVAERRGVSDDELEQQMHDQFRAFRATLQDDRRHCWSGLSWSTWPAKSSGLAVSARGHTSCCFRVAISRTRCSCSQGGDGVGPGRPPAQEPLPPARRTSRRGPASDAGRQRLLPRLDQGYRCQPLPVLAPVARHEGFSGHRDDDTSQPSALRADLRSHLGAGPRPIRRPGSRGRNTWAKATASTRRSPTSPNATQTRTSATSRRSRRRSEPADYKLSKGSDH
jgi:Uncharacterized protein conserved in bacteria (DUF2252)